MSASAGSDGVCIIDNGPSADLSVGLSVSLSVCLSVVSL